jgi:hypothetical protein
MNDTLTGYIFARALYFPHTDIFGCFQGFSMQKAPAGCRMWMPAQDVDASARKGRDGASHVVCTLVQHDVGEVS